MTDESRRDIMEDEAMIADDVRETKSDKFRKTAADKVNKIYKLLDQLGTLSNKSAYEYTDEDVNKIFSALGKRIEETKKKFSKSDKDDVFKFE